MNTKTAKELRGSIRAIVKEAFPAMFGAEAQATIVSKLSPMIDSAMTQIKETLIKMMENHEQTQAKEQHALLTEGAEELAKMNVTLAAFTRLVEKKLGVKLMGENFQAELAAEVEAVATELENAQTDAAAQYGTTEEVTANEEAK